MKQFIVDRHTTPNTPTLEQVPTEKIPIYENRAAVTADLANLTVGQIVATPDTGDELAQPVDVVEEDNLHAVTSSAVAEKFNNYLSSIVKSVDSTLSTTANGNGKTQLNIARPIVGVICTDTNETKICTPFKSAENDAHWYIHCVKADGTNYFGTVHVKIYYLDYLVN